MTGPARKPPRLTRLLQTSTPLASLVVACLLVTCLLSVGCRPAAAPPTDTGPTATRPGQAVRLLTDHLQHDDLVAFARDSVPPALHADLQGAWQNGARWPLDELPFGQRLPATLAMLAAPGAQARLTAAFDRQFAGADTELKAAAASMGLFGVQYLRSTTDYSANERDHFGQLVAAASRWGTQAPLGDKARGHAAIAELTAAARATGLESDADFRRLGMDGSLRALGRFQATAKQVAASYGLDINASLAALEASLQAQTGETATVRMRYALAGQPIDALVDVERIDGRWYPSDPLRRARAAATLERSPAAVP